MRNDANKNPTEYTGTNPAALLGELAVLLILGAKEKPPFSPDFRQRGKGFALHWQQREETASLSDLVPSVGEEVPWNTVDRLAEKCFSSDLPRLTLALLQAAGALGLTRDWSVPRRIRASFLEGGSLNRLQRFGEAAVLLAQTLETIRAASAEDSPLSAQLMLELAEAENGAGDFAAARGTWEALESHPCWEKIPCSSRLAGLLALGRNALEGNETEIAAYTFEQAMALRESIPEDTPLDIPLYRGLYSCLQKQGKDREALTVLEQLAERLEKAGANRQELAGTWLSIAIHAAHIWKLPRAAEAAEKALALYGDLPQMDSQEPAAWLELVNLYFLLGIPAAAEDTCRKGLLRCAAAGNTDISVQLGHALGSALLAQQKEEEAEKAYLEALSLADRDTENKVNLLTALVDLYSGRKSWSDALYYARQCLSVCSSIYPLRHLRTGLAWNNCGRCRYTLGDKEGALHSYTMALLCMEQLEPREAALRGSVLMNRAVCRYELRQTEALLQDLREGIAIFRSTLGNVDKTADTCFLAGQLLLSSDMTEEAESYLAQSTEYWLKQGTNPRQLTESALLLASARRKLQDLPGFREALALAEEAVTKLPDPGAYTKPIAVLRSALPDDAGKILPFPGKRQD